MPYYKIVRRSWDFLGREDVGNAVSVPVQIITNEGDRRMHRDLENDKYLVFTPLNSATNQIAELNSAAVSAIAKCNDCPILVHHGFATNGEEMVVLELQDW